jgi:transposase
LGIPTDDRSRFDDTPSYEELKEIVAALRFLTEQQGAQIAGLEAQIAGLKERLGRNPRNSSMPPSAEGLSKPPTANRAERRAAKRRPGKQPGSEGKHLAQVIDPDAVATHVPRTCTSCGADLADADVVGVERRQVFELPEVRAFVTEHRMERRQCACGCETKAPAPPEATAPACYGPGIRALAVYLSVYQHVPYDRLAEIFADVVGIPVSVGAIASMVSEAGGALGLFVSVVTDLLRDAPTVHFDETGARVEGSLHWVHVASSTLLTLLSCHKRRGGTAMDDMGVIAKMTGVAVHDGWKPYRAYDGVHALCNAHHLRELDGVIERFDQEWAEQMITLLLDAKESVEQAVARGEAGLDPRVLHSIRVRYGKLIAKGRSANAEATTARTKTSYQRSATNLVKRLDTYRDDVLRFTTDFNVPFSNNQGERDIRMVKLQQKISGSWRTKVGADHFCAVRSYVSTMKKQDYSVLDGLQGLFIGDTWLPTMVPRT